MPYHSIITFDADPGTRHIEEADFGFAPLCGFDPRRGEMTITPAGLMPDPNCGACLAVAGDM